MIPYDRCSYDASSRAYFLRRGVIDVVDERQLKGLVLETSWHSFSDTNNASSMVYDRDDPSKPYRNASSTA